MENESSEISRVAENRQCGSIELSLVSTLAAVTGLGHLWLFYRSGGRGTLLATYPWLSSDSFDYLLQAVVLHDLWSGYALAGFELPLLRNPGLVVLLALDGAAAGFQGHVFFVVSAVATAAALLIPAILLARAGLRPRIALVPYALLLLSPTSYFRGFVLADHIASILMYISAVACVLFLNTRGSRLQPRRVVRSLTESRLIHVAGISGVVGATFQIYALYPLLALICISVLWRSARVLLWPILYFTLYLAIRLLWFAWLPHGGVPFSFSLVRVSLALWPFYAMSWSFALLGLAVAVVPILLIARQSSAQFYSAGLIVATATSLFFYQWADLRLSLPLVSVLSASLFVMHVKDHQFLQRAQFLGASLAAVIFLTLAPNSFWVPSQLQYDVSRTVLFVYGDTRQVDRFGIASACGSNNIWCEEVELPELSSYETRIMQSLSSWERQKMGANNS